jgi:hypothetical protein
MLLRLATPASAPPSLAAGRPRAPRVPLCESPDATCCCNPLSSRRLRPHTAPALISLGGGPVAQRPVPCAGGRSRLEAVPAASPRPSGALGCPRACLLAGVSQGRRLCWPQMISIAPATASIRLRRVPRSDAGPSVVEHEDRVVANRARPRAGSTLLSSARSARLDARAQYRSQSRHEHATPVPHPRSAVARGTPPPALADNATTPRVLQDAVRGRWMPKTLCGDPAPVRRWERRPGAGGCSGGSRAPVLRHRQIRPGARSTAVDARATRSLRLAQDALARRRACRHYHRWRLPAVAETPITHRSSAPPDVPHSRVPQLASPRPRASRRELYVTRCRSSRSTSSHTWWTMVHQHQRLAVQLLGRGPRVFTRTAFSGASVTRRLGAAGRAVVVSVARHSIACADVRVRARAARVDIAMPVRHAARRPDRPASAGNRFANTGSQPPARRESTRRRIAPRRVRPLVHRGVTEFGKGRERRRGATLQLQGDLRQPPAHARGRRPA